VQEQHSIKVYDEDGTVLGDYYADLLIEGRLIVDSPFLCDSLCLFVAISRT
jgi:hypothetical protein